MIDLKMAIKNVGYILVAGPSQVSWDPIWGCPSEEFDAFQYLPCQCWISLPQANSTRKE